MQEKLTKIGQVGIGLNISQNHAFITWEVVSVHYEHENLTKTEI